MVFHTAREGWSFFSYKNQVAVARPGGVVARRAPDGTRREAPGAHHRIETRPSGWVERGAFFNVSKPSVEPGPNEAVYQAHRQAACFRESP